jgi:hypothetical protein
VIATEQRSALELRAFDRLPALRLAAHLGAQVSTPDELPELEPDHLSLLLASREWSAAIIRTHPLWIVYHPRHAARRREADIMHELSHVLLAHRMIGFDPETGFPLRRQADEDEATYLGGCLQIPRRGLLWALQMGMTRRQIAAHFGASEAMVDFRSSVTGLSRDGGPPATNCSNSPGG